MKKETTVLLLVSGWLSTASVLMAQQQKQPNIVFILADDMRASTLGCLGREEVKTPALDQLTNDATLFTNAHIMGSCNGAVSMPSRAMLMTGKYLQYLEKEGAVLPPSHKTMGEVLRQAGYETYHIGKWHNDKAAFNRTYSGGTDIFFGGMADHWNVPLYHYDPTGDYKPKRRVTSKPFESNHVEMLGGEYIHSGQHSVDIFTESALQFINRHLLESDRPFFLSLCYMSPHDPRTMPDEFSELYPANRIQLPANFQKEHPYPIADMCIRDEVLAAIPRQEAEVQQHIADYYAMISHLDRRVGEVIAALKARGLYDNTIILFSADNGLAVGQHGLMGKQNVYEHSVNVPLIIKPAEAKPQPRRTDKLCYLIDLFPTICELTGNAIPSSVDGVSLKPILTSDQVVRNAIGFSYKDAQQAVSDGEWKLIKSHAKNTHTTRLYNLKQDPMEIDDLSTDKRYRKRLLQMEKLLVQYFQNQTMKP